MDAYLWKEVLGHIGDKQTDIAEWIGCPQSRVSEKTRQGSISHMEGAALALAAAAFRVSGRGRRKEIIQHAKSILEFHRGGPQLIGDLEA